MKKIVVLLTTCFLLVGCGNSNLNNALNKPLVIGGSTSIQPLMEQLVEKYNDKHKDSVSVQGGGSSVGIKGAEDKTFDIGMSSRELGEEETKNLDETMIALDGIVLVVNKDNKVNDISLAEVKKLYTGEITNWKELGGDDLEIAVVSREEGSGTRDGFESAVELEPKQLVRIAEVQNATGSIISNVSGNKNAIGYISLGSMSKEVKVLRIDGVKANESTLLNGTYPLQRSFILCVARGSKVATAMYDFIFSEEGKQIIRDYDYVPVDR